VIGRTSPAEILRALVAIPTPSSFSNIPLLQWVRDFLEVPGWRVEMLPYQDDAGVEKANLMARPGGHRMNDFIDLAFVCHTDTVPYSADWAEALKLEERNGQLHGCGSCDVKGALACFLAAVERLGSVRPLHAVALILTADEEIGCKGMERLLSGTRLQIGSAIVSEPTSLRAGIAGKGYGLARITVTGRDAHSAFPHQGVSAISIAARLIARIEELPGSTRTDALFDPPHTTVNIGMIDGGTAKNIIPGRCAFLVEWRPIPGDGQASMIGLLTEIVAAAQKLDRRAEIAMEILRSEPGFASIAAGVLQNRLAALLPGEPTGISFGSEASRIARIAQEVIVIGPGDMRTAHCDRECVPVAELELWTEALRSLLF